SPRKIRTGAPSSYVNVPLASVVPLCVPDSKSRPAIGGRVAKSRGPVRVAGVGGGDGGVPAGLVPVAGGAGGPDPGGSSAVPEEAGAQAVATAAPRRPIAAAARNSG